MFELTDLFVDPLTLPNDGFGFIQLLFLMGVYGAFLFYASNLISDGSELLLLIPSLAGVVGSVVLPILGAIPDGLIVLFSGLGPVQEAQEQLSVGVGALAGSTVMLLTLPWVLSVYSGRVNIENGAAIYKPKHGCGKLEPPGNTSLTGTGVQVMPTLRRNAQVLFLTSIGYWLIQGEGFKFDKRTDLDDDVIAGEKNWALAGLVYCAVCFIAYIVYAFTQTESEDVQERINFQRMKAIENSLVSFWVAYAEELMHEEHKTDGTEPEERLLRRSATERRFRDGLKRFFNKFDQDRNGYIERDEMTLLLNELNESLNNEEREEFFQRIDANKDQKVDFNEFEDAMKKLILRRTSVRDMKDHEEQVTVDVQKQLGRKDSFPMKRRGSQMEEKDEAADIEMQEADKMDDEDEDEEEEEEIPEDIAALPRDQQQKRILLRSLYMMGLGTLIVVLFSDPAVDVLAEFGTRSGIPAFYVAFVLAPLASNASELIAAYNYAKKKTTKTITISLETLLGAGIMNNTLGLAIFLGLIYGRELAWEFSAETISIIFVEWVMVVVAYFQVQTLRMSVFVLTLYPLSLALVAILENVAGLN